MLNRELFNSATVEEMADSLNDKWQRYPRGVIGMWLASPDFRIAPEIKEALHDAVEAEDLYYNSDAAAREAMAGKIGRVNGIEVEPENVRITQGLDSFLWLAVRFACEPGDEVVLTNPMYGPFYNVANDLEIRPRYWELDWEDGYRFDEEKLKEIVGPRTKLIGVCNPHNPTGRVMTKKELKAIADIALDYNIKLFVDELWEDIRFDGKPHVSLASISSEVSDITVSGWGVSKTFGVAGLYIGYVASTNDEWIKGIRARARSIQRGCSTLGRAAAPVMLDETLDWWRESMMEHLHKTRAICLKRMNDIPGVTYPEHDGTYVPFPKFDFDMSTSELNQYLIDEAKVALSPGTNYGSLGEGHQRICIATSEAIIHEAIDRMEKALAKLSS
jgi:aspartate/methionine/tyrosine aminotransferase